MSKVIALSLTAFSGVLMILAVVLLYDMTMRNVIDIPIILVCMFLIFFSVGFYVHARRMFKLVKEEKE